MSARQMLIHEIEKLNDASIFEVMAYIRRVARREQLRADSRGLLARLRDIQFDGPPDLSTNLDDYVTGEKRVDDLP